MKRGRIVGNRVLAGTLCLAAGVLTMGGMMRGAASGTPADGLAPAAAAAGVVTVEPTMAMLASFTWTGNDNESDLWNDRDNWSGFGGACFYPCATTDDATFNACGFNVVFDASRTIDDLTLSFGGPEGCFGYFDADGTERVLTCDTVTIGGGHIDFVKLVGKAGIETN